MLLILGSVPVVQQLELGNRFLYETDAAFRNGLSLCVELIGNGNTNLEVPHAITFILGNVLMKPMIFDSIWTNIISIVLERLDSLTPVSGI